MEARHGSLLHLCRLMHASRTECMDPMVGMLPTGCGW